MRGAVFIMAGALAMAGCGKDKADTARADTASAKTGASVSIAITDDDSPRRRPVDMTGDSDSGKFEISLPGGVAAKVDVPGGMASSKFDIEGVGLYPGAKVGSFNVKAAGKGVPVVVEIGFQAPGDAAAIADWYQQQFAERRVPVTRRGETLTGKTADGDDFTLAMTAATRGTAGLLTIRDTSKG